MMADLCLDKNYTAIDYLETIYPIDLCYGIISGSDID